jgi:hypothetical protein
MVCPGHVRSDFIPVHGVRKILTGKYRFYGLYFRGFLGYVTD